MPMSVLLGVLLQLTTIGKPREPNHEEHRQVRQTTFTATTVALYGLQHDIQRPELIAAHEGRIYIFDYGDLQIKALSRSGGLLWAYGALERGEVVFVNPTHLVLDESHRIWINDPANRAVVVLSDQGRLVHRVTIDRELTRVVPTLGYRFIGLDAASEVDFGYEFDSAGAATARIPLPRDLQKVPPLARELADARQVGTKVAFAFFYAGMIGVLEPNRTSELRKGIEPFEFPEVVSWSTPAGSLSRVSPQAIVAALAMSADETGIYVLFAGNTDVRSRIVDRYSSSGAYLESYLLPEKAHLAVRLGETFVGVRGGPAPAIVIWTPLDARERDTNGEQTLPVQNAAEHQAMNQRKE